MNKNYRARTPFEFTPGIRRVFEPIFKYFNQVAKYFSGKKYRKLEDVFDAIRTGDLYQDAVDNPKILSPPQKQFQEELFKRTGYVGAYKGGPITKDMNVAYDADKNMRPLYSRTPDFGGQEVKASRMGFRTNLLDEAINNTKTKATKSVKWIVTNKQGQKLLTGSNITFSPQYLLETKLDEWLSEQVDTVTLDNGTQQIKPREVTIDEIKEYVEANTGIISVEVAGGDSALFIRATSLSEQETINYYQNEIQNSTESLNNLTSSIQSYLVNKEDTYKSLKEKFYTGPSDQSSAAFYDLVRHKDEIKKLIKN